MDRSERLKIAATELLECLRKYATHDDDVAEVLGFMEGFLVEIIGGKETPPMWNPFSWYFLNTEAPLYEKLMYQKHPEYQDYQKLSEAALLFTDTLYDGL